MCVWGGGGGHEYEWLLTLTFPEPFLNLFLFVSDKVDL